MAKNQKKIVTLADVTIDESVTNNITIEELEISSDIIANFLTYIRQALKEYDYADAQVEKEQKVTQDLLHGIEFSTDYKERCRLCTLLKKSRVRRRYYKDRKEELEPLVTAYNEKECIKQCMNNLSNVLGAIRKVENYHANRHYNIKEIEKGLINNEKCK